MKRRGILSQDDEDGLPDNDYRDTRKSSRLKRTKTKFKCLSCGTETASEDYCNACYFDSMLA
jgi:hypothetical protein